MCIDDIPKEIRSVLGNGHSQRINTLVSSIISESMDKPYVKMSDEISSAMMELRSFLFKNVYTNKVVKAEEEKAIEMLGTLFEYFVKNPNEMPDIYVKNLDTEPVERCVCDFISGMTDRYAVDLFRELFVPNSWRRNR